MSIYADSSALVTLYADERGRDDFGHEQAIAVSAIARVEVPSALWQKQRAGDLSPAQAAALVADFEADYLGDTGGAPRFAVVAARPDVLAEAARLCATHGLRAYDAVQLSSALTARAAAPDCSTFAAYDEQLRRAAAAEGFGLLPS